MSGDLLDDYLDWCQHALIGPESSKYACTSSKTSALPSGASGDIVIENHFPIGRRTWAARWAEGVSSRSGLPAGILEGDFEGTGAKRLRPAEGHAIWNSRDVFGTLAEDYEAVLGRAAKWTRTGQEYLSGVVELYERRFVRWWENEKEQEGEESGVDELKS
jgi:RNA polymerase I-specific transcription initiation factor RRN7